MKVMECGSNEVFGRGGTSFSFFSGPVVVPTAPAVQPGLGSPSSAFGSFNSATSYESSVDSQGSYGQTPDNDSVALASPATQGAIGGAFSGSNASSAFCGAVGGAAGATLGGAVGGAGGATAGGLAGGAVGGPGGAVVGVYYGGQAGASTGATIGGALGAEIGAEMCRRDSTTPPGNIGDHPYAANDYDSFRGEVLGATTSDAPGPTSTTTSDAPESASNTTSSETESTSGTDYSGGYDSFSGESLG